MSADSVAGQGNTNCRVRGGGAPWLPLAAPTSHCGRPDGRPQGPARRRQKSERKQEGGHSKQTSRGYRGKTASPGSRRRPLVGGRTLVMWMFGKAQLT